MLKRIGVLMGLGLSLCANRASAQEVGNDVPPSHWAYDAVKDLAGKGLIKGYPPDSKFLGKRVLTRYEMATILERVLARMDDIVAQKADKADLDKLTKSAQEIHDLIEEFKKELLVIGSDLSKAKDDLAALHAQVDELSHHVDTLDQRTQENARKAEEAARAAAQAQKTADAADKNSKDAQDKLGKKMGVSLGPVRFTGLIQTWYGNPLGATLGGQYPLNSSSVPPGRNYGGGVGDTFRIRRVELGIVGNITPRVDYFALFDLGKIPGFSTSTTSVVTSAGGKTNAITSLGANASNDILQDAWIGYQITPRLRVEVGGQKTGMSEEGNRSSMQLLTIERAIMNGLPTNAGRVGYVRDTGAVLRYKTALGNINVGIWNDNGPAQNTVDADRTKFANIVANYTGTRHLTVGLFGGSNIDDVHPKPSRDRAGGTLIYQNGPHFFEAEGAYTLDQSATTGIAGRSIGLGGYALYAYSLNKKWQLVGRYDEWDPAVQGNVAGGVALGGISHHNLREYTLGVNYYFYGNNAKIQLNWIDEDTQGNGYAFFGVRRQIILTNFSAGF